MNRWAVFIIAVASLAEMLRWHVGYLALPQLFNGDAAQHIYWMRRWAEPGLFQGDWSTDYFSAPALTPPGHWLLYRLAAFFIDPLWFSEALFLVTVPATMTLLYLAAAHRGGNAGGAVALLMFTALGLGEWLIGGFARVHAPIALLLCVNGWLRHDGRWVAAGLVYGGLFYPPIALVAGLGSVVMLLVGPRGWSRWWLGVAGGVVAAGLLVIFAARSLPPEFGERMTYAKALADPAFGPGGRNQFFVDDAVKFYITGGRTGIGLTLRTAAVTAVGVLVGLIFRPRQVPLAMWVLAGSGLLLWAVAHATLFALYLPSRHAMYAVPMFVMLAASAWVGWLLSGLRPPRWSDWQRALLAVAAAGYVSYHGLMGAHLLPGPHSSKLADDMSDAYAVLESLPPETLVAAHMADANFIPMHARRPVLTSHEISLAYHDRYYREHEQRVRALLRAYYGPDWADVVALHEQFGVDVLLLNKRRLNAADALYFRPFAQTSLGLYRGGPTDGMAAWEPPPQRILWQSGKVSLIWLGPLDEKPHFDF